ncbi:hypothetical protein A2797_02605 [candidate division WWE3 bacterium RIFCSPHIGHO2_01_FULL_48_15]|uniref:S1 motif domain-containing protein n=1 Tax=candidate division WWE3 bacterium RIFCSPHIGHO2_01_FULL_48_15 TaxID=1802619 RepID=A0A1F4VA72_UNCKA|nr:MAG: hypothetical protein A2797_02605 [candidate division WWE3 bacterium RIFCSPHIGHO2_01_FULL_48_15]
MKTLLEKTKVAVHQLRPGDVVEGTVLAKEKGELVLNIGAKSEGLVTGRDFEEEANAVSKLKVGDRIFATVLQSEDNRGFTLLSLRKARAAADWREAQKAYEEEKVQEVEILGPNRGGVVARFGSIRGFIPFSQLSLKTKMEANMGKLTGKVLRAKIIEIDQERDRLVFSERDAFTKGERAEELAALAKVKIGETYDGEVTMVTPFAAFVSFDSLEGMIHVSELSWEKVAEATRVVAPGDKLKVQVMEINSDDGRIMLSHRRTLPNPWEEVAGKFAVGGKVKGKITKITDFGAFVELAPGIEGLIHITETTGPVAEGDEVEARILEIDPKNQKIALSLKGIGAGWR